MISDPIGKDAASPRLSGLTEDAYPDLTQRSRSKQAPDVRYQMGRYQKPKKATLIPPESRLTNSASGLPQAIELQVMRRSRRFLMVFL